MYFLSGSAAWGFAESSSVGEGSVGEASVCEGSVGGAGSSCAGSLVRSFGPLCTEFYFDSSQVKNAEVKTVKTMKLMKSMASLLHPLALLRYPKTQIGRNQPSLRRCRPQLLASPHPQRELRFLMQAPPGHKETQSRAKPLVTLARSIKKSQLNACESIKTQNHAESPLSYLLC